MVVVLALGLAAGCRRPTEATITADLVTRNNQAVGLMGQYDFDAAATAFDALRTAEPSWSAARLNLAIALVNRQGPSDSDRAEGELRALADVAEVARRARYTLALLLMHEGRDEEAGPLLASVAEEQPPDGFAAYFAGQLQLASNPAGALEWFRRASARAPLLRSAHYGAFLALRRLGRDDEAATALSRFQELERHPQAQVAEFKYTRMGPLAEAITVDEGQGRSAAIPSGPRFLAGVPFVGGAVPAWRPGGPPRSITVADIDGDGALDVFIAGGLDGPVPNAVVLRRGDAWLVDARHPLASVPEVRAAIWADLDDNGLVDVVLGRPSGGTAIWRQNAAGEWAEVEASARGSWPRGADVVDGAAFDADHDGDLDLWLVNAAGPHLLLNNDGAGRFRWIGDIADVAGDGRSSRGLVVADLDNDRDADVMVIKTEPPHDVFLNNRVWSYQRDGGAATLSVAPLAAAMAADLDADGDSEIYALGQGGLERWRREGGGDWRSERLAPATAGAGARLAIGDTNGDGRLEVLATSDESWAVHEVAAGVAADGLAPEGGRFAAPGGWTVAHLDPGRGPSVVGVRADGVPVIWGPGSGRHSYLSLGFSGRDPASDQRRSNASGLGTRVAVRTGSQWTAFDTTRLASGPGQSLQPTTVGLGGAARADFVSLTWSDGVFQTELALEGGRLHRIAETQRQLSSCPVLFAWDGSRYRFVTDVLGVGGIGFFERPGVYSEPLPRENVLLPHGALVASDGVYRLKIAEPMEEVTYLDRVSLVAYDLPPGWRMALDERKAVNGPAPSGAPIFYREERLPIAATDQSGANVTARLRHADLAAVGPGEIQARFIGLARPFTVTVTFERPIDRGAGRPVLLVDGWVEYPYAQTVFAAWQAGAVYEAPTLEARDGAGRWHEVAREFGYPAGMPRQMAFPLPALPPGTTALRLHTSQEIYWDRIAVVYAEPAPAVRRQVLPLRTAELQAGGFARRTTGPQRAPHYDDDDRLPLDDTRHPRGWYTAFGSIEPLVAEDDAAVAIFGPGEEVTVAFEAPRAAAPEGWTRQLVLEARGWCKDMDLYTRDGETIEPLPGADTAARRRLHALFNTRYASGH